MTNELMKIRDEPGPGHQCMEALLQSYHSWNPIIADQMITAGASHYIREDVLVDIVTEHEVEQFSMFKCIACGGQWSQYDYYGEEDSE